jgi:hypothetical protein
MKRGCTHIPKHRENDPIIDQLAQALKDMNVESEEDLFSTIANRMFMLEDEVLKKVASQCLGRDFTLEDAHLFTISMHDSWEDKYQLNYNGIPIGMIERNLGHKSIDYAWLERQPRFSVTFTPFTKETRPEVKPDCERCGSVADEVYHCEMCDQLIGSCCQAGFNQFTQIDFNCCKSCAEQNPE